MMAELRGSARYTVVGACLSGPPGPGELDVPATSGLAHLRSCVEETSAEAVVVIPCRHLDPSGLRRLTWQLEGSRTPVFVATGLHDLGPTRAAIRHTGPLALIELRHARLGGPARAVKQVWERAVAVIALVVLAPALLALAAAVRLESRGPALFRQTRVGRVGRTFTMLKLRTMCADAEDLRTGLLAHADDADGVLFKMRRDPRVTRVGRFLRTYSLDELPQLVNVARGDMALVGPRPPLPSEVERYDHDTRRRLAVTPGLTGLWQVSGRSDLSWEESVRLDLRYVENWSLGLDLHILTRTAGAVLRHRGAY
jgi:exopolysaccharide biosynthesis polyprenyl glycosylphosphotransferase